MKEVVTREESRAFDAAWEARGIPGVLLMENAGRSATDHLLRVKRRRPTRWILLCGPGNNGGDGFVVARHLHARGEKGLLVRLFADPKRLRGDARVMFDAMCGVGIVPELTPRDVKKPSRAKRIRGPGTLELAADEVIVDALFGTGLSRPLEPWCEEIASWVRERRSLGAQVVSLDLPSGLDANLGTPSGAVIEADQTITFGHLKRGLLTPVGRSYAGKIVVGSLGVSPDFASGKEPPCVALERCDVEAMLREGAERRGARAHKYTRGHVWIVGGSPGKLGALHLAARGAFRMGAGAVTAATWADAGSSSVRGFPEIMTSAIPQGEAKQWVEKLKEQATALVLGPGLGTDHRARMLVETVLRHYPGPVVLDADVLTLLGDLLRDEPDFLRTTPRRQARAVLPHGKEASRLLGAEVDSIEHDRYGSVTSLAQRTRGVTLLKGAHSLVTTHETMSRTAPKRKAAAGRGESHIFVMPLGSPLLAVAGSGDVLAGMVGALATRLPLLEAVLVAGWMHAKAGESLAKKRDFAGLLAHEIADEASSVLASLRTKP